MPRPRPSAPVRQGRPVQRHVTTPATDQLTTVSTALSGIKETLKVLAVHRDFLYGVLWNENYEAIMISAFLSKKTAELYRILAAQGIDTRNGRDRLRQEVTSSQVDAARLALPRLSRQLSAACAKLNDANAAVPTELTPRTPVPSDSLLTVAAHQAAALGDVMWDVWRSVEILTDRRNKLVSAVWNEGHTAPRIAVFLGKTPQATGVVYEILGQEAADPQNIPRGQVRRAPLVPEAIGLPADLQKPPPGTERLLKTTGNFITANELYPESA